MMFAGGRRPLRGRFGPKKEAIRNVNLKENAVSTIDKVAVVQISPVLYSRQGTIDKVVKRSASWANRASSS